MDVSPSGFKRAVTSHGFPSSEPIFYLDLNSRAPGNCASDDPCLFLFRPAGPEGDWHDSLEAFWASALFNFLEDRLEVRRFEELGLAGEYRAISRDEATRELRRFFGTAESEFIEIPTNPTSCYLVYDQPDLKALAGTDSAGFFAVIWGSR